MAKRNHLWIMRWVIRQTAQTIEKQDTNGMSESQWNYLGLSHNPFSDPQQEFFPGADREAMLGKVRKLSQWSRPILCVSGPHGVGKTCLFRALSSSLEAGVVAARVNGSLVSRAADVLSALVQGYGVAAPAGADAPLLIELIIAHLKDQSDSDRTSLVLVDDAHLLEQRAVDDLVNLAAAGAKLAFFSEPQFIESLQRAVERNAEADGEELLWQEMLLSPFSREQTGDYLTWRFAEAGYNGRMPFSEHQADEIHNTSEGYPGRLDFAANEKLMLMTVGGSRTAGIPRKHLWLAGGLAVVLGLTLWLWSPGDNLEVDSKTVKLELPKANEGRGSPVVTSTAPDPVRTQPTQSVTTPVASVPSRETAVAAVEESQPTLSRTVQPVTEAARPAPEPVANPSRTVRPAAEPPKPEPKPEPKPQPTPTETVVAKPEPASTTTASGARSASWMLAQNDASYTIQLIGFGDADRANAYLAKQERPSRFALYRSQSGDRIVHVVTFGVYGTKAAAETAVGRLPETIGKVTPWIRSIGGVKGAIRKALQSDG